MISVERENTKFDREQVELIPGYDLISNTNNDHRLICEDFFDVYGNLDDTFLYSTMYKPLNKIPVVEENDVRCINNVVPPPLTEKLLDDQNEQQDHSKCIKNEPSDSEKKVNKIVPKQSRVIRSSNKNKYRKRRSCLLPYHDTRLTLDRPTLRRMTIDDFEEYVSKMIDIEPLTEKEFAEVKRQRRLINNRELAARSRNNRKKEHMSLLNEVEYLRKENEELKETNKSLLDKYMEIKDKYDKISNN